MNTTTLSTIKKEISKFLVVIESIADYWKLFPHYTLISVLIQNAAHDSSNCVGYNHDDEVNKLRKILSILRELKEYHNSYFEEYVFNEIDIIIMGHEMSEAEYTDASNDNELNKLENQTYEG